MTTDLMKPLYNLTKFVKQFPMEDVFLGILIDRGGLNTSFNKLWQYWSSIYDTGKAINFTKSTKSECFHFVIVDSVESFYIVWNLIAVKFLEITASICET